MLFAGKNEFSCYESKVFAPKKSFSGLRSGSSTCLVQFSAYAYQLNSIVSLLM